MAHEAAAAVPHPNPGSETYKLVHLPGGRTSLRSCERNETFHPVIGPMREAHLLHVGQQRIVEQASTKVDEPLVLWDVGLGAAANAIATLEGVERAEPCTRPVELHSFDRSLSALEFTLRHAEQLSYPASWKEVLETLAIRREVKLGRVHWRLHLADIRCAARDPAIPSPAGIYFDPYAPKSNAEVWTVEMFRLLLERATALSGNRCLLTCYSRSTAVRSTLLLAGWYVGRGVALADKDETTIAATHHDLLAEPLGTGWLERVSRSTAPGPLWEDARNDPPGETAAALAAHPQFKR